MTDRVEINNLLQEMRALKARAKGFQSISPADDTAVAQAPGSVVKSDFQQLLSQAVDQVNAVQKESANLAKAYEAGDPNVMLSQVVVASEKSSIAFEAMTEVRNRLVNAYEDIMNMPI
ncbi:flagellar hook-basal body complex protein FliE [bacterium]|nr:flagellar hook-basal body complex protein FliE [bacterium]